MTAPAMGPPRNRLVEMDDWDDSLAPEDGDVVSFDAGTNRYGPHAPASGLPEPGPNGDVLLAVDGEWESAPIPNPGASSLDELNDVNISEPPPDGYVLTAVDGDWEPRPGLPAPGETGDVLLVLDDAWQSGRLLEMSESEEGVGNSSVSVSAGQSGVFSNATEGPSAAVRVRGDTGAVTLEADHAVEGEDPTNVEASLTLSASSGNTSLVYQSADQINGKQAAAGVNVDTDEGRAIFGVQQTTPDPASRQTFGVFPHEVGEQAGRLLYRSVYPDAQDVTFQVGQDELSFGVGNDGRAVLSVTGQEGEERFEVGTTVDEFAYARLQGSVADGLEMEWSTGEEDAATSASFLAGENGAQLNWGDQVAGKDGSLGVDPNAGLVASWEDGDGSSELRLVGGAFGVYADETPVLLGNAGTFGLHGTQVAQAAAPTAADPGVPNSGDATTDAIIANLQARVAELEAMLGASAGIGVHAG